MHQRVCFYTNKYTEALAIKQEDGKPRDEQVGPWMGQRQRSQATAGCDKQQTEPGLASSPPMGAWTSS